MPTAESDAGTKGPWELIAQRGNFVHRGRLDEKAEAYALAFLILKRAPVGTEITLQHHGLLRTRREIGWVKISDNEVTVGGYRGGYTLDQVPDREEYERELQPLLIKLKWADMTGFPTEPHEFPSLEEDSSHEKALLSLRGLYAKFGKFDYFQAVWDTRWPDKIAVLLFSPIYAFQLTVAVILLAAGLPFLAVEGLKNHRKQIDNWKADPVSQRPKLIAAPAKAWTRRLATGARLLGETVVLDGSFLLLIKTSSRTVQSAVVMGTALSLLVAGKLVGRLTREKTESQVGVE